MKNDDQMYQSVLSRYAEYQENKKKKRNQTIRRTVPVFACFCLTIALGVGYWEHFRNLPQISVQPNVIAETTTETHDTTTVSTITHTTISTAITTESASSSTIAPTTLTETARMTTTAGIQTKAETTVVTDESETPTTEQIVTQTETQAPATTSPVTYTQSNTQPTVVTTEETQAPVTTPPVIVTQTNTEPPVITSSEAPQTSETESVPPEEPSVFFAQPIPFADIRAAAEAVKSGDVSAYTGEERRAYRQMFERFNKDGFLYQVIETDAVTLREDLNVCLFPETLYEDTGIGCYVTYGEKNYHIMFYCTDDVTAARSDGIADYLLKRMGRRCDKEIHVSDSNVSLFFAGNGQSYAGAFIDREHYFAVNSVASEEEMIEFIEALSFETLPLS